MDEKSSQVPLMGQIYSRAKQVLIWAGEEDDKTSFAMALIRKWGAATTAARDMNRHSDNFWRNALDLTIDLVKDPFSGQEMEAFGALLARPYWRRMWIIQEVVLTADSVLICGQEEVAFEQFWMTHFLLSEMIELNKHNKVGLEKFVLVDKYVKGMSDPTNITLATIRWLITLRQHLLELREEFQPGVFLLASRTRAAIASDPRDKIYGLFGLLPSSSLPIQPDYYMDVAKVYTSFTLSLIRSSLRILTLAGIGMFKNESAIKLPSWVPDFSREPDSNGLAARDTGNDRTFRAAKEIEEYHSILLLREPPRLVTQGIVAGEITTLCTRDPDVNEGYHFLWDWFELAKQHCPENHPSGVPLRQAFFRNIARDASGYGYDRPDFINADKEALFFSNADGFLTLMRLIALEKMVATGIFQALEQHRGEPVDLSLETDVTQLLNINKLYQSGRFGFEPLYWVCNSSVTCDAELRAGLLSAFIGVEDTPNRLSWPLSDYGMNSRTPGFLDFAAILARVRSLVITERGYIGIGPYQVEKGDLVCVLLGCPVPMIVRKKGLNYILVGEVYVYGMMHGEMIDQLESGKLKLETILLE
jgi:hypothetical protein